MIELSKLEDHLKTIQADQWRKVFELLPEIKQSEYLGEIEFDDQKNDIKQLPYWKNSEIVNKFIDTVYNLNIIPAFDWTNWEEGKLILKNSKQDLEQFDQVTLCKLLTVIIRTDRFCDGFLNTNFENNTIPKILESLKNKTKV
ncbi:MAG: DUF6508 domain-containing protein [Chitinophagaceae bacterium]